MVAKFYDIGTSHKNLDVTHVYEVMGTEEKNWIPRQYRPAAQTAQELANAAQGYSFFDGEFKPRGALRVADQYAERIAAANGRFEIDPAELKAVVQEGYAEAEQALKVLGNYKHAMVTQQTPAWKELDRIVGGYELKLHELREALVAGGSRPTTATKEQAEMLNKLIGHTNVEGHIPLARGSEIDAKTLRRAEAGLQAFNQGRQKYLTNATDEALSLIGKQEKMITDRLANIEAKTRIPRVATTAVQHAVEKPLAQAAEKESSGFFSGIGKNISGGLGGKLKVAFGAGFLIDGVRRIIKGFAPGNDVNGQPQGLEPVQIGVGAVEAVGGVLLAKHHARG